MVTQTLKQIQTNMLKEFIEICENNKLQYFVIYGTLLGTIRHKGFIPWDDDIDVIMARNYYETFMKIGQKSLSEHLFLQNHITDKNYLCNFAKIRNNETTFIEIATQNIDINHGVYIDIFPLDGLAKNKLVRTIHRLHEFF